MVCNSKAAGSIAKQSEIWDLGVVVTCVRSNFDLLASKVIWRSFGALVSKWLVTGKLLAVE